MASTKAQSIHGGKRCVAGGPNMVSCGNGQHTQGVSIHLFPDAKKDSERHKKWVKFVRKHRPDWKPSSKTSILCGIHFEDSCFVMNRTIAASLGIKTSLKPDAVPTIDTANESPKSVADISSRERRKIVRSIFEKVTAPKSSETIVIEEGGIQGLQAELEEREYVLKVDEKKVKEESECDGCRCLKTKVVKLQKKVSQLKKKRRQLYSRINELITEQDDELLEEAGPSGESSAVTFNEMEVDESSDEEDTEDVDWVALEDAVDSSASDDDDDENKNTPKNLVRIREGTRPAEETKFIVFYSMLVAIFKMFCFYCKADNPSTEVHHIGTMATVTQKCKHCGKNFKWKSQPSLFGKYPAGNIMMSFGILTSGIKISQVLLMFRHMGLSAISPRTYFYHQKKFLFPSVLHHWENYRSSLLEELNDVKDAQWSGDGRFDSMGHSAKYGTYTMYSNSISRLVHFELLQANQSGSSNAMELDGAKRCFQFIKNAGLKISSFISDRHKGLAKWIRESQPDIKHYHDIWHVCKGLTKKLLKASKEKGHEAIKYWMKGIRSHLYWCAHSTKQGFGQLTVAKWKSILRHISNKHNDHPDELYKECAHGEIEPRDWIPVGTSAHYKLTMILCNKRTLNDVKSLSSDAQTSCLEGFHSTLNHWHPKMQHFSWLGTYCRHILAICHFNENLRRQKRKSANGSVYYNVVFPKFKLGEEVVREVAIHPTYAYVDKIRNVLFTTSPEDLSSTIEKYKKRIPEPLSAQFKDRRPKHEAIAYQMQRKSTETPLYPQENEQDIQQQILAQANQPRKRKAAAPHCRKCNKPMKGHPRGHCDLS